MKTYCRMTLEREAHRTSREAPSGIRISPLRGASDLLAVARVYGAAFGDQPWPPNWTDFPGFDPDGVFLAYEDTELAGFVVSYVRPGKAGEGYISVVATAPSHRRRGVARALVNRALERFWGLDYRSAAIDVAADNLAAVHLYQSLGFRKVEEFAADERCREACDPQGTS